MCIFCDYDGIIVVDAYSLTGVSWLTERFVRRNQCDQPTVSVLFFSFYVRSNERYYKCNFLSWIFERKWRILSRYRCSIIHAYTRTTYIQMSCMNCQIDTSFNTTVIGFDKLTRRYDSFCSGFAIFTCGLHFKFVFVYGRTDRTIIVYVNMQVYSFIFVQ